MSSAQPSATDASTQPTTARPTVTPAKPTSTAMPTTTATPTKPADDIFTKTPPASFPILPRRQFSTKAKGSFIDYDEGMSRSQMKLNLAFNTSRFPQHNCRITGDTVSKTNAEIQKISQAYVTCLTKAWQGFAKAKGSVPLSDGKVYHCGLKANKKKCDDFDTENAAAMAGMDGEIFLNPYFPYGYGPDYLMIVLSHEVAHHVQGEFSPDRTLYGTVTGGVYDMDDTDGSRYSRRTELQAQCLAVGMVAQGKPLTFAEVRGVDQAIGTDNLHWDETTVVFWVKQGLKGQIGECNVPIAARKLTDYQP